MAPEQVKAAAAAIRRRRPAGIVVAARGSSDHAAIYLKYLLETRNRLPVTLAAPSVFGIYRRPPELTAFAVVGISQSGASPDVAGVLREARAQGALTIAITGTAPSNLSRSADHLINLQCGRELSVPASKTYSASLLAVAMLSQALDPDPAFERALAGVPDALAAALRLDQYVDEATPLLDGDRFAVIGRGYNLATAHEIALKLMETSYVLANGYSIADFLHGPVAALEPGLDVVIVEAAGPTLVQMRSLGRRIGGVGARAVTITDRPAGALGQVIPVETGLPEDLTPLPFSVVGQLLALRVAAARGHDPDRPRQLRKVTRTY